MKDPASGLAPMALFAADLHLDGSARRECGLRRLLDESARKGADLYLLGDVFHYWFGPKLLDDDLYRRELRLLKECTGSGTRVFFLPGNRDFLIDEGFAAATGVELLPEVFRGTIQGESVCLTHGDVFSTQDRAYQRMKGILRSRMIGFLAKRLPGWLVRRVAGSLRRYSERVVRRKCADTLAPDEAKVRDLIHQGVRTVVCGHFHEARMMDLADARGSGRFFVLEPFEERGYCLRRDRQGWSEIRLSE